MIPPHPSHRADLTPHPPFHVRIWLTLPPPASPSPIGMGYRWKVGSVPLGHGPWRQPPPR